MIRVETVESHGQAVMTCDDFSRMLVSSESRRRVESSQSFRRPSRGGVSEKIIGLM